MATSLHPGPAGAPARVPQTARHDPQVRRLQRLGVTGAVLALLALGLLNALTVRPFFPGDESAHVTYALEVSSGRLPLFDDPVPLRMPGMVPTPTWTAMHPPLYYVLVAAPLRLALETGHPIAGLRVARVLTLLMAAGAVVLTARLAAALVPRRPAVAVVAAGGLALVPSFQQLTSFVYNDALSILATTATLVLVVLALRHGCDRRGAVLLAGSAAVGAAARASALEVAALAALAAATPTAAERALGWRRRLPAALARTSLVGLAVALTSGWFYLRNLRLYGSPDGSTRAVPPTAPRGPAVLDNATSPRFWLDEYRQLWGYVTSNAPVRGVWWVLASAILVAAGTGLLVALRRWLRAGAPVLRSRTAVAWLVMGVHAALVTGSVLAYFARGALPFGRYFFPLLPLLPVLAAVGFAALPGARRGLPAVAALLAAAAVGVGMAGVVLVGIDPSLGGAGPVGVFSGALAAGGVPVPGFVLAGLAAVLATGLALLGSAVVTLSGVEGARPGGRSGPARTSSSAA